MPRRPTIITVERANRPDPEAAAEAILPLFLAFLQSRRATNFGDQANAAREDTIAEPDGHG